MAEYYLLGCHKERINYPAPWGHFVQLTQISKKTQSFWPVPDASWQFLSRRFSLVNLLYLKTREKQKGSVTMLTKTDRYSNRKKNSVHLLPLRQEKTVIKLILQTSVLSISYKHNGLTTGTTCNWFRGHDGLKFMSFSRKGAWAYRLS